MRKNKAMNWKKNNSNYSVIGAKRKKMKKSREATGTIGCNKNK